MSLEDIYPNALHLADDTKVVACNQSSIGLDLIAGI